MSNIAVYHPYFGNGGAESVCMHVLEALQDDHELTLVSMSEVDLLEQNEFFNTRVRSEVETTQLGAIGKGLTASMTALNRTVSHKFGRAHAALFSRVARSLSGYDLVFSTHGELVTKLPSVQYIHYPWYNRSRIPNSIESRSRAETIYNRVCYVLAGHDDDVIRRKRLLTNSEWTADLIEELYDVRPSTINPPLVTDDFDPLPWEERENGFVCVGRLSSDKNIPRNMAIVEQLRERGHEVHLHVVGPTHEEAEAERIERLAAERPFVILEGKVPRERLVELICSHRYGLHGKEYEHFGIAVAELVAGGTIPFVPNSGGQREIVGQNETLLYDSTQDVVEKADEVLADAELQESTRRSLPVVDERFGPDRFKRAIQEVVAEVLNTESR